MATLPLTLDAVLSTLEPRTQELRRLGVRRLALFGSMARGEAAPDSDLDFLVELQPKTFDSYMDTKFFLERLFGMRVDLVLMDTLKPRLKDMILREAVHAPGL